MSRPSGVAPRWSIAGGLAIFVLLGAWTLLVRVTDGPEAAGMGLVIYGWAPGLVGYGLLVVGVALGVRTLLLPPDAAVGDRLLWILGEGVALLLTVLLVGVYADHRDSTVPAIGPDDQYAILGASLVALQDGRVDVNQVAFDPVFPEPPVMLRTHRPTGPWTPWTPSPQVSDRMLADGIIAGICEARNVTECSPGPRSTFVTFAHSPSPLTGYVSVQLDVARPEPPGCRPDGNSADFTTFRIGVVRDRVGWEVGWIVTVGGGPTSCGDI